MISFDLEWTRPSVPPKKIIEKLSVESEETRSLGANDFEYAASVRCLDSELAIFHRMSGIVFTLRSMARGLLTNESRFDRNWSDVVGHLL